MTLVSEDAFATCCTRPVLRALYWRLLAYDTELCSDGEIWLLLRRELSSMLKHSILPSVLAIFNIIHLPTLCQLIAPSCARSVNEQIAEEQRDHPPIQFPAFCCSRLRFLYLSCRVLARVPFTGAELMLKLQKSLNFGKTNHAFSCWSHKRI